MSAQELLAEFHRTGKEEPFAEIVRRYAGMVYHVCLQVTKDVHDAEDATQAVFLTLAVRGKTAQEIKYLAPWLQRVGHRLSLDIRRSKKRRSARENKHHEMNRTRLGDGNNTAQVDLDETKRILRDELDKLPSKYRLPLILHYFGGLKPEEMARELGCKPSTLGVRLHRGRKLLADSMKGRGITLTGGMLGAMLLSLVQHGIEDTILQHTSHVGGHAIGAMAGNQLAASSVPLHVLAITRVTARAIGFARAKAIIAIVLIVASLAGAKEIVNKVEPFGLHINLNWTDLIRPLLRNFLRPLQYSSTTELQQNPQPKPQPTSPPQFVDILHIMRVTPSPVASTPTHDDSARTQTDVSPATEEMAPESVSSRITGIARVIQSRMAPSNRSMLSPLVGASGVTTTSAPFTQYADGTFKQFGGSVQFNTLRLDSLTSMQNYVMSSGRLYADRAIIGDHGSGSFKQTGGEVNVAHDVTLGANRGASGVYVMSGNSKLSASDLNVGAAGNGQFEQSSGETHIKNKITLGSDTSGDGIASLTGGTMTAGSAEVARYGRGTFHQSGGDLQISSAFTGEGDGRLTIGVNARSRGEFAITSGKFEATGISIGHDGAGSFALAGGQTSANTISLADSSTSSGTARLRRGDLYIDMRPSPAGMVLDNSSTATGLIVGDEGSADLVLGDEVTTPEIAERPPSSGASLVVRAQPGSQGMLRGWGAPQLTGSFIQNGQVVADGFGKPRELDLSRLKGVLNTIDNAPDDNNGWFARRGGRLVLPSIQVNHSGQYNWGESPDDRSPDLVNSVRLSMHGVQQRGTAQLTLMAPDDPSIPGLPNGETFLGVWEFQGHGLKFQDADVWIRYDEGLASQLGVDASTLKIWSFDESWKLGGMLDLLPDQRLIGANIRDFQYFAVAGSDHPIAAPSAEFIGNIAPEPGATMLLLMCGSGLLLRRRRRR